MRVKTAVVKKHVGKMLLLCWSSMALNLEE